MRGCGGPPQLWERCVRLELTSTDSPALFVMSVSTVLETRGLVGRARPCGVQLACGASSCGGLNLSRGQCPHMRYLAAAVFAQRVCWCVELATCRTGTSGRECLHCPRFIVAEQV